MAFDRSDPMLIRSRIKKSSLFYDEKLDGEVTPGKRGLVVSLLNTYCRGDDVRHILLGWIFGDIHNLRPKSIKELSTGDIYALYTWINPEKDEAEGIWLPSLQFEDEIYVLVTEAVALHSGAKKPRIVDHDVEKMLERMPPLVREAIRLNGILVEETDDPLFSQEVKSD